MRVRRAPRGSFLSAGDDPSAVLLRARPVTGVIRSEDCMPATVFPVDGAFLLARDGDLDDARTVAGTASGRTAEHRQLLHRPRGALLRSLLDPVWRGIAPARCGLTQSVCLRPF
jgi:hypothetical protein